MKNIFTLASVLATITLLTSSCGRKSSTLGQQVIIPPPCVSNCGGGDDPPNYVYTCVASLDASPILVPTNSSGQIVPPDAHANISVRLERNGYPILSDVLSHTFDSTKMQEISFNNQGYGRVLKLKALALGTFSVGFTLATPDRSGEATCAPINVVFQGVAPPPPSQSTLSFTANSQSGPIQVFNNYPVTYSWNSTNMASCILTKGGVQIGSGLSGEITQIMSTANVNGLQNFVYTVTCLGLIPQNNKTLSRTISVMPNPQNQQTVNTSQLNLGGKYWVTWQSIYATKCFAIINGGAPVQLALSGTQEFTMNVGGSRTHALNCIDGHIGSVTKTVTVTRANPMLQLTANDVAQSYTKQPGDNVVVRWNATPASDIASCTVTSNKNVPYVSEGSRQGSFTVNKYSHQNVVYTFACQTVVGPLSKTLSVTARGQWYPVTFSNWSNDKCQSYCNGIQKQSILSPDDTRCASGENRPNSAQRSYVQSFLSYPFGCYGPGSPDGIPGYCLNFVVSVPGADHITNNYNCYHPGQVIDDDSTDRTVACFCG